MLILKRFGGSLAAWFAACIFFELWTSTILAVQLSSPSSFRAGFSVLAILGLLLHIVAYIGFCGAVVLAAGRARGLTSPHSFAPGSWLKDLTLETLKAGFFAFLWLLALVIPGLVRWARYSFFPAIVIWEPEYQENRVHALKSSVKLSKGHMPLLLLAPLLFIFDAILSSKFHPHGGSIAGFALSRLLTFYLSLLLTVAVTNRYFEIRKMVS